MKEIQVLLGADAALIRSGIRALLEKLSGLQIVATSSDGHETLQLIRQHQPDVAVIASTNSTLNGFEVTARVKREYPGVNVIVLLTHADEEYLRLALACGAAGCLTMTASAAELELAIKTVAKGQTHFSSAATKLLEGAARGGAGNELLEVLSPRQREVLKLIAEGNSTKQIALILRISVKTVETHRKQLSERLDIHDIAGLVVFAIKAGLIRLKG